MKLDFVHPTAIDLEIERDQSTRESPSCECDRVPFCGWVASHFVERMEVPTLNEPRGKGGIGQILRLILNIFRIQVF